MNSALNKFNKVPFQYYNSSLKIIYISHLKTLINITVEGIKYTFVN